MPPHLCFPLREQTTIGRPVKTDSTRGVLSPWKELSNLTLERTSSLRDTSCTFPHPKLPHLLFASLPSLAPFTTLHSNLPLGHFLLLLYCKTPLGPFSFTSKAIFNTFCALLKVNLSTWFSSTGVGPQEMVWLGLLFKPGGTWERTREGGQDTEGLCLQRISNYNITSNDLIKKMGKEIQMALTSKKMLSLSHNEKYKLKLKWEMPSSLTRVFKNIKYPHWQKYEVTITLTHCWCESNLVNLPPKIAIWQFRSELQMHVYFVPATLLLRIHLYTYAQKRLYKTAWKQRAGITSLPVGLDLNVNTSVASHCTTIFLPKKQKPKTSKSML